MRILKEIKSLIKRNDFIFHKLLTFRAFLIKHKDGLEFVSYTFYKFFCRLFYNKKNNILSKEMVTDFHKRNVLILESFVSEKTVEKMADSFRKSFSTKKMSHKYLKKNTLPKNKFLKIIRFIVDRYIKNIVYYYDYPVDYLDQVNQVVDPLNNIIGFKKVLKNKFLPVLNDLMKSNTDIYRAWAYKTINIDKKETHNVQNSLHRDGDIWSAIKCIIYLCDVDENNGPFAFLDIDGKVKPVIGKKGTVVFFKCAFLKHKGSNTINEERLAASFTAYPSFKNKIAKCDVRPDFIRKTVPFLPQSKDAFLFNL